MAASRAGLRVEGHGAHSPLLIGIAGALFIAAYCVLLDCFFLKATLPADYGEFLK